MSKKITCECLRDSQTGEPLVIEFPDDFSDEKIRDIRISGWESGARMRMGFESSKENE